MLFGECIVLLDTLILSTLMGEKMSRIMQQWNITIYIGDKEVMMKGGKLQAVLHLFSGTEY